MPKFVSPPERLLRSAASHASKLSSSYLQTTNTGASSASTGAAYRAAFCAQTNKPLVIKKVYDTKQLGPSELRIRIRACAINFADILMCQGAYQEKPNLPFIPGTEIAGDIIEIGSNVTTFKKGDKVLALVNLHGFAEQCITDVDATWKIPNTVSYATAATLVVSYATAYMAFDRRAELKKGETVLVTAAAGGTGLAAVDLGANVFGANVIGAAGSAEKTALAKVKGAMHAINYREQDIKTEVLSITKRKGVDVVFDAVGGDTFEKCLRCTGFGGRLLTIGYASGSIPKIPANILLVKNISAVGLYWVREEDQGSYRFKDPKLYKHSIDSVVRLLGEGKIHPHVGASFPLNKINEAFQFIKDRKSTGKIAITMD
ncbi:Quinone oxidoreductase-like protein 2-like protein [Trichoplax sp. H2]|nr:Quinone oxidoreductase-like protein 2-like protein [Trichoplax sp. H2]|eukprot:RDD46637.1 Quinone oxidoreductase-like protein 2-like protein [Trichoplax sp. H2]